MAIHVNFNGPHVSHTSNGHNHPLNFVFLALIVGGHLLYKTLRRWKRARVVQDTPVVPIASAPQGFIEIEGYAWPKKTILSSPVDGQSCLFFSVQLQQYRSNGKSGSWVTVFSLTTNEPFYVVDHSGAVVLVPNPGECSLNPVTRYVSSMSDSQRARLFNLAGKDQPHWYSGKYRVIEEVIPVGSPFYVLGDLVTHATENHTPLSYAGAGQFINKIKGAGHTSLLEFQKIDSNHDGVISAEEWTAFCSRVAGDILSQAAASTGQMVAGGETMSTSAPSGLYSEPKCVGTLATTTERSVYFADCHKETLENRLRSGFYWKIAVGAAFVAAGIAYLAYLIFEHQM